MAKLLVGLLGASALAAASAASAQVVPLNTPTTISGSQATYTTGAGTITANGFSAPDTGTDLYAKNGGGLENGLGLTNDPSGQNEISDNIGNFIQFDLSALASGSTVSFLMGSTTDDEGWAVFGTNDWGCATSGTFQCGTSVITGINDQGLWHTLTGGYDYYDFYATGTSNGTFSNVLISSLNVAVPEPSTWAMMLLGFGAIGMAARRKKVALAQLA